MVDAQARASGGSRPLQAGTPGQRDVRVLAALASLVVLVALAGFLWYERTQELEAASSLSARRAASLAGSLRETLDLAQAATDRIESTLGPHADAASVRDTLRQTVQEIGPLLGRITLPFTIKAIDREGRILQPSPDGGTDASDRLPLPQGSGWRVESARGAPGERVLPLLRGAADPSRGVAAFVVQLDHAALLRRFDASRVPDGGSAALFRVEADGSTTLLAHAPHREAELGQRERGPLAAALARAPKGVFDALTQFDQTRRIVGYQRLGGDAPDLVVAYGMSTDAVLAGWRGLWLWAAGVALLLVGAIAAGGRRLERSLRAQARDQQALQRSESHFRALAGNLPDVVVRMDREGRHLYANDAVQRATGLAPQAFIGKTNAELGMPARNVALWTATLGRVFDRGTTERLEFTYPGPQGVRHWESLVALEPAAPGEPATAVVISRDITERRQAEAAREALNRRVVDLLETMSDGFVSLDRQWRYQAVNRKAGQMLGRDAASLIGKHIWTEFPEGVGQPFHRAYERAMNEGTTIRMEEYYPPWDAWFENRIHPTADGISIFFTDITERRRAADALQRSEQRLREAQRMARLGHWELDLTTGALVWSDEIFRIFEIDPQRFGASYAAFLATVHPDDRDGVDLAYRRSVQEHQPYAIGHRLLLADGRIKHVQERGDSSYADDGTPLRSVGTVQDITDRVLAEQALRASEASHREMFESNPHPMWVYELETLAFLAVNDAAIRQYGYTRDEFLGMTIKDIRPREDVPRLLDKVARVGQGGLDEAGVWRHQTRDGRLLEVEITSHTLQFDGRPAELVLAHDVTRRIQVERTLRDSEERLRLAMQAANQGLYDLDLRTGDTVVSPEYARMLGYEPDEFHETNAAWRERLHPDDRDTVYRAYEDYVAGRIPDYRVEFRQRTTRRPMEVDPVARPGEGARCAGPAVAHAGHAHRHHRDQAGAGRAGRQRGAADPPAGQRTDGDLHRTRRG